MSISHRLSLILFYTWVSAALLSLCPVVRFLDTSFPIFTVLFLVVPAISILRSRNTALVGFRLFSLKALALAVGVNLLALLVLMLSFEPWSHTYQTLVTAAVSANSPDPTFAWLVRLKKPAGWLGMLLFSGFVTLFAEELFFRGWLLQRLQKSLKPVWAVIVQAAAFTLPQTIAALLLPPLQGVLYAVIYSFLAIGIVGGWVAVRTQSIWPSLVSATTCNLILCILIV